MVYARQIRSATKYKRNRFYLWQRVSAKSEQSDRSYILYARAQIRNANYFKVIREEIEAEENEFAIDVRVKDTDFSTARELVGIAEGLLKNDNLQNSDEIYVVYDKNGYTKHQEAFEFVGRLNKRFKNKTRIIFSSIAFEHWVLLHFEKSRNAYLKSPNIIEYLQKEKYFPNYDKAGDTNIYHRLENFTNVAYENAAWLRFSMGSETDTVEEHTLEMNPYTNVDSLVARLLNGQLIRFCNINEPLRINKGRQTLRVVSSEVSKGGCKIQIELINVHGAAYLFDTDKIPVFIRQGPNNEIPPEGCRETIQARDKKSFDLRFSNFNPKGDTYLVIVSDIKYFIDIPL